MFDKLRAWVSDLESKRTITTSSLQKGIAAAQPSTSGSAAATAPALTSNDRVDHEEIYIDTTGRDTSIAILAALLEENIGRVFSYHDLEEWLGAPIKIVTKGDVESFTVTAEHVLAPSTIGRADLIEIKVNGLDAAKQNAMWLTKGPDRSQPAICVRLVDCTSDHLKNIVANKPDLSADYLRVIESILSDRGENTSSDLNL